jgi:hypothetical protein
MGHHFKADDYFAVGTAVGQLITAVDKSDPFKDVITVGTTLGVTVAVDTAAYQTAGANSTPTVTPSTFASSNEDVVAESNLFVSTWVMGVLKESSMPKVTDATQ